MRRILSLVLWALCVNQAALAHDTQWQYPVKITNLSNLECDCWDAIDRGGYFPLGGADDFQIDPTVYLVGAPPTQKSAISITTDRWRFLSPKIQTALLPGSSLTSLSSLSTGLFSPSPHQASANRRYRAITSGSAMDGSRIRACSAPKIFENEGGISL
ncbi:MAG: hypothetical protein GY809_01505 [Planctomycetes bacterium]|nr:hypothetical protein [Planctomycetota bacterium]